MSLLRLLAVVALVSFSLAACEDGKDGADGTNGSNGSNGANRSNGSNGTNGEPGRDGFASAYLEKLGTFETGAFDESAAEIVAFDAASARAFVVNGADKTVDILDVSNPSAPTLISQIDVTAAGTDLGGANSVDVYDGTLAVAIEADPKQNAGLVAFYQVSDATLLGTAPAGALPDMLTFSPDGNKVLVANEGEPNDDYDIDPEGTITVIDVSVGFASATATQLNFNTFDADIAGLRQSGVRIFGPGASVSQDLEPEYIAVSPDSSMAWVSLQENNALAVVDLNTLSITDVLPLGTKNHSIAGFELDASDRDNAINIMSWPVLGMFQPDSIAAYESNGRVYLVTANEGDARDYAGFSEEVRIADVTLDPTVFPTAMFLQDDANLGRLQVTNTLGDEGDDDDFDALYAFGARSFSIWDTETGTMVFDSGSDFEVITAQRLGSMFNTSNDENEGDSRSDAKGPEPEALAIGDIDGQTFAFIGLERTGGIMVYNIENPENPVFCSYMPARDFSVDFDDTNFELAGDLGPEGIEFVSADNSPTGENMLLVANEVSGTTTLYTIRTR
ncbi:MAG: choice-of-anchor I family protein [Polyangiales bacterium]